MLADWLVGRPREREGLGAEKRERGGGTEEAWKKLRGEGRLETVKEE